MATKRQQKNRALRRKQHVNPDDLAPKVAEGLTQGLNAEEAAEALGPVANVDGRDMVAHMAHADDRITRRDGQPWAAHVATSDTKALWSDGVTDRVQMDLHKTYTAEGMRLLQEGRQCLRCDEPHPDLPFPPQCDLCGYAMRERQIMDIAMEFDGMKHLGPSAPISEFLAEQEERVEKRKFIKRVADGGQGRIPKAWLADATLLDGLVSPAERAELIRTAR